MMNNIQVKSKERVSAHGEVFTAEREVKAMCDLVNDECMRTEATFLEPACGDGNFLAEILTRKLSAIENDPDYVRKSLIALSSLYGIDILEDNVNICRERLFDKLNAFLLGKSYILTEAEDKCAKEIIRLNIIRGDTLKPAEITFTQWTFKEGSIIPKKEEFSLSGIIYANELQHEEEMNGQLSLPYEHTDT